MVGVSFVSFLTAAVEPMADKAPPDPLQEFSLHLTCSICLERYKEPKGLPCQHSFCKACLEKTSRSFRHGKYFLKCPSCRMFAQLPDNGVSALPPAFVINNFLELHQLMEAKGLTQECPEHKKPLEVYCQSCQKLICLMCGYCDHKTHNQDLIERVFEQCKEQIEERRKLVEQAQSLVQDAREVIETRRNEIQLRAEEIKKQIHLYNQSLKAIIDEAEGHLKQEIDMAADEKARILSIQEEDSNVALAKLQSCDDFIEQSLKISSQQQIIASKGNLLACMDEAHFQASQMIYAPIESPADLFFMQNGSLADQCRNLGVFHHSYIQDRCYATGDVLLRGKSRQENTFELNIRDKDGSPIPIPKRLISCHLTVGSDPRPVDCIIIEVDVGRYEISYNPFSTGSHQLRVMVGSRDIPNSPFSLTVFQPLRTISNLKEPYSVTVSSGGMIVVSECGAHRITLLNGEGERIHSFGSRGSGPGQFEDQMSGVTMTADDRIVVADRGNCRIQLFNMDGQFVGSVGEKGLGRGQFSGPRDVAVHPNGQIFVADAVLDRITVFDRELSFLHSFGKGGSEPGEFYQPNSIAIDSRGRLYVTDSMNNRIQVFSSCGEHLGMFSSKGSTGSLLRPISIAIDSSDIVYVTEKHAHKVSMFAGSGEYLQSIGNKATGDGEYQMPQGLATDPSGNLYVCDRGKDQLVIINIG